MVIKEKNKPKKREDELRDKIIDYRTLSIVTFGSALIIISTMFLCSSKVITIFEKSCLFVTIITVLFENRYLDNWFIKYKDDKLRKDLLKLLKITKFIISISFISGVYSILFIT